MLGSIYVVVLLVLTDGNHLHRHVTVRVVLRSVEKEMKRKSCFHAFLPPLAAILVNTVLVQ